MSVLQRFGLLVVAAVSLVGATLAFSGSADARHRGWRSGAWVVPVIAGGYASGTTIPAPRNYRYGYGYWYPSYGYWNPSYAPAGPFVDYPYWNCGGGVCWY